MPNDTILPFGFPAIGRKKLVAAFDGGVLLLSSMERRLGIAKLQHTTCKLGHPFLYEGRRN